MLQGEISNSGVDTSQLHFHGKFYFHILGYKFQRFEKNTSSEKEINLNNTLTLEEKIIIEADLRHCGNWAGRVT